MQNQKWREELLNKYSEDWNLKGCVDVDGIDVFYGIEKFISQIEKEAWRRGFDECQIGLPNPCFSQDEVDRQCREAEKRGMMKARRLWWDYNDREFAKKLEEAIKNQN